MRLLRFEHPDDALPRIGLLTPAQRVIDLERHAPQCPTELSELIATWPEHRDRLQALLAAQEGEHALAQLRLLAPIARPGKIFCTGLNYADHVHESGMQMPTEPVWFVKAATSVNAPFGAIELPRASSQLDYEAELAFIIGQRCRHVPKEQAHEVIFGYCVANDVSVRDWQLRTSQFSLGKSFDTHLPYGPWLVTADEVPNPHALDIRCSVNGELRQHSNTRHLVFDCFDLIAHLSQAMTLEPGDLILSGTPGGVGLGFKPPRLLRAGDVVRTEISGLGTIENTVMPEPLTTQEIRK